MTVEIHSPFEGHIKAALAPLAGKSISALKVLYLAADVGPWLDTGLAVEPGDQITVVLDGRVWLSRQYDISLEAPLQVWRRIGDDGEISRGLRDTDTFVADRAGTLRLKNLPTRWLDRHGHYAGEPAAVNPDAGGGVSVALIRWAPQSDVAAELRRVAAGESGAVWAEAELARLSAPPRPPEGWTYLWELGPAEIFQAECDGGTDGGPQWRIAAHTRNDVAILQREASVALDSSTTLQWTWKVDRLPAGSAEDTAITHDYLSIAVEFDNGQDLTYMWSRELPVEYSFRCPLEAWRDRETHVVVRSGDAELGIWLNESRNVLGDYERSVGGVAPTRIVRVWLIANSVFGRDEGVARFGNISVGNERERMQVL